MGTGREGGPFTLKKLLPYSQAIGSSPFSKPLQGFACGFFFFFFWVCFEFLLFELVSVSLFFPHSSPNHHLEFKGSVVFILVEPTAPSVGCAHRRGSTDTVCVSLKRINGGMKRTGKGIIYGRSRVLYRFIEGT